MERSALIISSLGILVTLGGCAGQKAVKPQDEVQTFCTKLYADRAIDPVRAKIAVPIKLGEPMPIERLADRTRASDTEKPAILALAKAMESCSSFGAERLGPPPYYRSVSNGRIGDMLAQLYAGDITFGQFARETLMIGERDQLARQQLDEEIQLRARWKDFHDASDMSGN